MKTTDDRKTAPTTFALLCKLRDRDSSGVLEDMEEIYEHAVRLETILRDALAASGCDGDLCAYRWHQDAREALQIE